VLVALGAETAAKVLPHLSDTEVEELSLEIARLGSVPAEVRQQVITEFYEVCLAQNLALEGGLDHAREMLERAYGPERAQEILTKLTRAMQMLPFDSIKRVHPAQLSTFLQDEHPQTIALVLAYLDPQVAAAVLWSLPPELRPEVAERLATMGSTPPEVIRRVENVLQRKLSSHRQPRTHCRRWCQVAGRSHPVGGSQHRAHDFRLPDRQQPRTRRRGAQAHVHLRRPVAAGRPLPSSRC
jgi:flagellar motor switch protein FliG